MYIALIIIITNIIIIIIRNEYKANNPLLFIYHYNNPYFANRKYAYYIY